MALPATYDFAGTGALSASWTAQLGTFSRASGVGQGTDSNYALAFWNADAFDNDQYSQAVIPTVGSYLGVSVRASGTNGAGTETWYGIFFNSGGDSDLMKRVNAGTITQIAGNIGGAVSNGQTVKLEVTGTTLKVYRAGAQQGADQTDSSIASGSAGICAWGNAGRIDDWEGGNLGGTAYTLDCDAGTFAHSGTAAGLLYGRQLGVDAGAFAWSGTAAGLLRGYQVGADAGVFGWSGIAAGLLRGYQVGADAGAFSWSGTDAGLLYGRQMAADAGGYAWAGTDAALLYGRVLQAAGGTYAWTGTDAELTYTPATGAYTLNADAGAFTWSGTAAALLVGRQLGADAGAFAWTGTAAGLLRGYPLTAEGGSFAWSGADAALLYARVLEALGGTFPWTGTAANLVFTTGVTVGIVYATGSYCPTVYATGSYGGPRVEFERAEFDPDEFATDGAVEVTGSAVTSLSATGSL